MAMNELVHSCGKIIKRTDKRKKVMQKQSEQWKDLPSAKIAKVIDNDWSVQLRLSVQHCAFVVSLFA